ncbi:MAG: hypothetical protein ACK53Y_10560 [bacterium]
MNQAIQQQQQPEYKETRTRKVTKTSIQNNLKLTSQPAESAQYPAQSPPKHRIGSANITHGRPSGERRTAGQSTSEPQL